MFFLDKFLFIVLNIFLQSQAQATGAGITYHGRLIDPNGQPVISSSVQFRIQIRTPGTENCLLYEELQVKDMSTSDGIFSITINDGSGTRLDSSSYSIDQLFANRGTFSFAPGQCSVGTTYASNTADGRRIQVYFNDGSFAVGQWEPTPSMPINYVPSAIEAIQIGGYKKEQLLKLADGVTTTGSELDAGKWNNLLALINGTSTVYSKPTDQVTQLYGATLPAPVNGQSIRWNSALNSGTGGWENFAPGATGLSSLTSATGIGSLDNTNYSQSWNWSTATTQNPMSMTANSLTTGSILNLNTSSNSLNSTNGLLNITNTGTSTNGVIAKIQSNSTAGSGLTVLANGNVGIGTTTPSTALQVATYAIPVSGNRIVADFVDTAGPVANTGGGITFSGQYDLSGVAVPFAGIQAGKTNGTIGNNAAYMTFATRTNGSAPAERMRIDSSGNVGIGTTSPANTLDVFSSTGEANLRLRSTNNGIRIKFEPFPGDMSKSWEMVAGGGIFRIADNNAALSPFVIEQGSGANAIYIKAGGNVGIGITNPTTKLQVAGVIAPTVDVSYTLGTGTYRWSDVYSQNPANNTSDFREKKEIQESDLGLEFINKLKPVSYRWKNGTDLGLHYGLIAQETEQFIKESRGKEELTIVTYDKESDRFGLRYSELISPLIKSIQELYSDFKLLVLRLTTLETKTADKDKEISALKQENAQIKAYLCEKDPTAIFCH